MSSRLNVDVVARRKVRLTARSSQPDAADLRLRSRASLLAAGLGRCDRRLRLTRPINDRRVRCRKHPPNDDVVVIIVLSIISGTCVLGGRWSSVTERLRLCATATGAADVTDAAAAAVRVWLLVLLLYLASPILEPDFYLSKTWSSWLTNEHLVFSYNFVKQNKVSKLM